MTPFIERHGRLFRFAVVLAGSTAVKPSPCRVRDRSSSLLFLGVTMGFGVWAGSGIFLWRRGFRWDVMLRAWSIVSTPGLSSDFRECDMVSAMNNSPWPERTRRCSGRLVDGCEPEGMPRRRPQPTGAQTVGERSATADLLADVIQRTPSDVPYWRGETYVSLVGAFVPRILWPDKPEKNIGQRFGHRYELHLGIEDTGTSINLPVARRVLCQLRNWDFAPIGGIIVGADPGDAGVGR